jgi:hypothetical protein
MRRFLLPFLFLLAACSTAEAPSADLIERDKFKQVLLRAQLVEARLNHEMVIDHRTDSPVVTYYAELFKEEGVTEEQFKRTFQYYTEHPLELKAIYAEILVELDSLKENDRPQPSAPK